MSCSLRDYSVSLTKNGRELTIGQNASLQRIQYGRRLDAISTASVLINTPSEDCCGQLAAADHWNTDLIISSRNDATGLDEVVWRGPCKKPRYRRGQVQIDASDVLVWLQVRAMLNDLTFTSLDVSDIFIGIWNDAVVAIDPPVHSIARFDSGLVESRKIEASSQRMGWNVVSEMLEAGLDVTTFGSQVVVGVPAFTAINLKDTDVVGEVEVVKDGDEFGNRIIAGASRDIVGIFPPGPRQGRNGYPLVEVIVSDSQLSDQQSADNAAKARYDYSGERGVRRVVAEGGLKLLPTSGIDVRRVIAGQLINFAATETCYTATETFRLGSLDVVVEKAIEDVTIGLQPLGGVAGGATL